MTEREDKINKPNHYTQGRKFEPIHVIRDWELNFALGNAVKYISRAGRKTSGDDESSKVEAAIEDLKKAAFYVQDQIKALEASLAKVDLPKKSDVSELKSAWNYQIFSGSLERKSPNPDTFVHPLEKAQDESVWNGIVTKEQLDLAAKEAIKAESLSFKTKTLEEGLAKCLEIGSLKDPVIFINNQKWSWKERTISYNDVLELLGVSSRQLYTMVCTYPADCSERRRIMRGENCNVWVYDGMVINCFRTDKA